ncbi:MAG: DUF4870 domain-containing protein [Ignavibacteriota bacterium]
MQNEETTSDERLMAMLSHLSILFGGIILPIILWATQKDKSKFVRYHALQAIFFHIAYAAILAVVIVALVLVFMIFGIGLGAMTSKGGHHSDGGAFPAIMVILMIVFYGGLFISIFGAMAYEIYLAIKSYQGSYIKIPIIGKIIYKKVYGEL